MIRKFISLSIFLTTISIASFGENYFGRNEIAAWAKNIQVEGPTHAQIAMKKTDRFLNELSTKAGTETPRVCYASETIQI